MNIISLASVLLKLVVHESTQTDKRRQHLTQQGEDGIVKNDRRAQLIMEGRRNG